LATLKDITGHRVDDKDAHILSQLDEAIASMITLESDSCELLAPVLAKDSAHGLANGLLAFELLRQPRLAKGGQATVSNVHKSLATLEQRCSKGKSCLFLLRGHGVAFISALIDLSRINDRRIRKT
jgi:hypothetical protein